MANCQARGTRAVSASRNGGSPPDAAMASSRARRRQRGGSHSQHTAAAASHEEARRTSWLKSAVERIEARHAYATKDRTVAFSDPPPRRPTCAAARQQFLQARTVLEDGRLAVAVLLLEACADGRQPDTIYALQLARAALAELGDKATGGQVRKFEWAFRTKQRLQKLHGKASEGAQDCPGWLQHEAPLRWPGLEAKLLEDQDDLVRAEPTSPVAEEPSSPSADLAESLTHGRARMIAKAATGSERVEESTGTRTQERLPSLVRPTVDGGGALCSPVSPYRVFVMQSTKDKFSVEEKEWLFRRADTRESEETLRHVVEHLQNDGIASLHQLSRSHPKTTLIRAGCPGTTAAILSEALASRFGPNILALPDAPHLRRIRTKRADLDKVQATRDAIYKKAAAEFDETVPFEAQLRREHRNRWQSKNRSQRRAQKPVRSVSCPVDLAQTPPQQLFRRDGRSRSCPTPSSPESELNSLPPASPQGQRKVRKPTKLEAAVSLAAALEQGLRGIDKGED